MVNGKYYRDVLLMTDLLPDIRDLSDYFIFKQDSAPSHWAKETVRLLENETPEFIPPTLCPPNSPDLNPVVGNAGKGVQKENQQWRRIE